MNIDTIQQTTMTQTPKQSTSGAQLGDVSFSDELSNLSSTQKTEKQAEDQKVEEPKQEIKDEEGSPKEDVIQEDSADSAIDGLQDIVEEMAKANSNQDDELNRTDEKNVNKLKINAFYDDENSKEEENGLIDNNMNIQEPAERLMPEMNTNMNFNSNGQPFSEFINPDNDKQVLKASAKDIAEEKSVLSTMEENIAIANKNMAMKDQQSKIKTVTNEHGIKKVDINTNVTVDTIANFDSVIMTKADVEFFSNLVNGNLINLNDVQNAEKSAAASKTLLDLLAKSMEDNKPVRIDFDNNISVIIKISRDGKISADFLPSSQVAEAYLKENLPLLKQRFDDNNIEYEELNHRQQNQNNNNENRKKGRKDE